LGGGRKCGHPGCSDQPQGWFLVLIKGTLPGSQVNDKMQVGASGRGRARADCSLQLVHQALAIREAPAVGVARRCARSCGVPVCPTVRLACSRSTLGAVPRGCRSGQMHTHTPTQRSRHASLHVTPVSRWTAAGPHLRRPTGGRGGGGGGGVYSYSMDTIEGPRAPAVKLTARHSSLTRVRAAPLSPW